MRELCKARRDLAVVGFRHRARVKEVASVVKLHMARERSAASKSIQRSVELPDERTPRRVAGDRVLPQVAHHATPRAFAAGQEDRCDRHDRSTSGTFVLEEDALVLPGIV